MIYLAIKFKIKTWHNKNRKRYINVVSSKSRLVALLLCVFLGYLGIHRFYAGKIGTGILWLLTGGIFGIGALVDLILIACGTFKDNEGKLISDWQCWINKKAHLKVYGYNKLLVLFLSAVKNLYKYPSLRSVILSQLFLL